jgi:uncharacterized membrane protein YfcA
MNDLALLAGAGLLAGAMNALTGGGSFVTLPALIAAGVPSVQANASSTVALFPGGIATAWTYYERVGSVCGIAVRVLVAITLAGGFCGSLLLLLTPSSAFNLILPWLLLLATLALIFGRRLGIAVQGTLRVPAAIVLAVQFVLGIYGGYFGGAVGLMMLAAWSLMGETQLKALNFPRTLLVSVANSVAVLVFVAAGAVWWPETLAMLAGVRLGRVVPPHVTRAMTLCFASGMTGAFFWRAYFWG